MGNPEETPKLCPQELEGSQRGLRVSCDLGSLARQTGTAKGFYGRGHATPNETPTKIPEHGVPSGMREGVETGEEALGGRRRDDWTRGAQRDVAEQLKVVLSEVDPLKL